MDLWTPEEKLNYIYAFFKFDNKDVTLDFWQDDYIRNRSRFIALLKSRQTGFSFIVAAKGLVKAMDPARTKYTKQFVSYNEGDAQEKIRYAREFYESIPGKYKKKLLHSTSVMLEFEDIGGKTTSRLISLPCRPPRGRNGDVCLDEFAIYSPRQSVETYKAALFCTLRHGCIEVGSTPFGTKGEFYDICTDNVKYPTFDRYFVPWYYARALCNDVKTAVTEAEKMELSERVNKFGTERLLKIWNATTADDFRQECECVFIDTAASYISLELIYANTPGRRECDIPEGIVDDDDYFNSKRDVEIKAYNDIDDLILGYDPKVHGAPLYLGYDVARDRDAAAFYIIGLKDGKKRSVMRYEKRDMSFESQKDYFRKIMKSLPIFRACMDCTGMGAPLCEELKKEFGERVEGVLFTVQSKEEMAMSVKFALERGEFLLENDKDFHAQIHSIKRTPTVGGNFRYDAERNENGHADSFWAWALCNYAIKKAGSYNFYADYFAKRAGNKTAYNSNDISVKNNSIIKRGKTLESVLRKMYDARRIK